MKGFGQMNAKVSFAVAGLACFAIYEEQGKKSEAAKLKDEIRTQFPDAVTHKGRPMKDIL